MGEARRANPDAPAARRPRRRLEEETGRRRAAEEELAREKQFSEAVLDSLAGAFYLLGRTGRSCGGIPRSWPPSATRTPRSRSMQPDRVHLARDREAVEAAMRAGLRARARDGDRGRDRGPRRTTCARTRLPASPLRVGDAHLHDRRGARHHDAQAHGAADGAREGAARPRAQRLAPWRSGTGICARTACTSTRAGRTSSAPSRASPRSRATRCLRGTIPTTAGVPRPRSATR